MKKLSYLFVLLFALSFVACTPTSIADESIDTEIESTGHGEVGDNSDNGDDEEEVGG